MDGLAEYIWIDGTKPTAALRSKARFIRSTGSVSLNDFPEWSFDGSSTGQSLGHSSDLLLKPVCFYSDPLRGAGHYLVLSEVLNADSTPHATNTRALLREILNKGGNDLEPWLGFEQEYTLFKNGRPLGWPEVGYPRPQGPFYCSVGANNAYGRPLIERHAKACIDAKLMFYGLNSEVMPGQWEFQIGYRGLKTENADALRVADDLWVARWLLHRIAEEFEIEVRLDNKPVSGDWNGAGCHTNVSTRQTRNPDEGLEAIRKAVHLLSQRHEDHICVYGDKLAERLTGKHETCSIHEFRSGIADRGSSVRIPQQVQLQGYGYLEDRRPGANCDPYLVAARLIETIASLHEKSESAIVR